MSDYLSKNIYFWSLEVVGVRKRCFSVGRKMYTCRWATDKYWYRYFTCNKDLEYWATLYLRPYMYSHRKTLIPVIRQYKNHTYLSTVKCFTIKRHRHEATASFYSLLMVLLLVWKRQYFDEKKSETPTVLRERSKCYALSLCLCVCPGLDPRDSVTEI